MLAGVLLLVSQASFPNLSLTTRATTGRPGGAIETTTVQIKGQRQRHTFGIEVRDQHFQSGFSAEISQCDRRRAIMLNDAAKIYGILPMPDRPVRRRAFATSMPVDTRPVTQTTTIDARDMGERRKVGPLEARHVITTWSTETVDPAQNNTRVVDGWYVDLPSADCEDHGAYSASAFLIGGSSKGRSDVKWRGRARTGFPIEEIDRTDAPFGRAERRVRLVSISDAPLPDSLFDIPAGYRPALPMLYGGFDMQRADTWTNRAVMAWETASAWLHQWWR